MTNNPSGSFIFPMTMAIREPGQSVHPTIFRPFFHMEPGKFCPIESLGNPQLDPPKKSYEIH